MMRFRLIIASTHPPIFCPGGYAGKSYSTPSGIESSAAASATYFGVLNSEAVNTVLKGFGLPRGDKPWTNCITASGCEYRTSNRICSGTCWAEADAATRVASVRATYLIKQFL